MRVDFTATGSVCSQLSSAKSVISESYWNTKMSGSLSPDQLLGAAAQCIPPLCGPPTPSTTGGCVAVIGGSADCSGPPCLAAMAALRAGAERVHVVCAAVAAPTVRTFSPELAVHPALDAGEEGGAGLRRLLADRMPAWHAVLVGPGLAGDCPRSVEGAVLAIELAVSLNKPLVIDGDALCLVAERPDLIRGYPRALLTPNAAEFDRLYRRLVGAAGAPAPPSPADSVQARTQAAARLSAALSGPCVLLKGREDAVAVAAVPPPETPTAGGGGGGGGLQIQQAEVCSLQGCGRRCAGQGAILSGLALVFSHWCFSSEAAGLPRQPALLAAYAASALTRRCGAQAFAAKRRATLATDMLDQIGAGFSRLFPEADCAH